MAPGPEKYKSFMSARRTYYNVGQLIRERTDQRQICQSIQTRNMHMPRARVGDIHLSYTVRGEGEWLVLIGGYASSNWASWGAMLDQLARHYRVLAFDNRGIADSDAPDIPYSTEMLARDTLGLMDHLGIGQARILGKSMGGAIGQWVALLAPERVRALAMTSTTSRPDARAKKMIRWWMDTARTAGFEALFPGELTYFYTADFYERNPDAIARAEAALIAVHRPVHGFIRMGEALIAHDTWERLPEIGMPTFLLCGADDMITPAAHSLAMATRLPHAEVYIIPDTLHGVMSEKPETFDRVLEFLKAN
jgi:3-oxoadipate enol-lactonase